MGIVISLLKRGRKQTQVPLRVVAPSVQAGPSLVVLLPDAGGIAAYQMRSFPTARAAEFYLDSTLRGQIPLGVIAFWALTVSPLDAGPEPLVLIKEVRRKAVNSVYAFSFSAMDAAYDFIRKEMMRGLQPGNVMLYFAASAVVQLDVHGRTAVHPAVPPAPAVSETADPHRTESAELAAEPEATYLDDLDPDDLLAEDLAEVVEMMQELSGDNREAAGLPRGRVIPMPRRSRSEPIRPMEAHARVRPDQVIDFPLASRRLLDSRASSAAAAIAWANICRALDAALDVHVGRQVIARLAWRRLARAFAEAALAAEAAKPAETHISADTMRRAWRNISWTLEEAVCAQTFFQRSARTGTDGAIPSFLTESRWPQRDEPFEGFSSPPGRF